MIFQTSITNIKDGEEIIRGHKLEELIQERSFVEVIYLLFQGELPSESHATCSTHFSWRRLITVQGLSRE
jgi:citrate synthase